MQYIFGYGSLIYSESRNRTTSDKDLVYPLKIGGYLRGWWALVPTFGPSTTFLGCVKSEMYADVLEEKSVNGVIYSVTQEEIQFVDKRERGYLRMQVNHENITDYCGVLKNEDIVWVYVNEGDKGFPANNYPTADYPIVQSYVDLCLNGCFEIERNFPEVKEFAVDFIRNTMHWNNEWVNDRLYPRRPFIYEPNANIIEEYLRDNLRDPSLLNNRKIE